MTSIAVIIPASRPSVRETLASVTHQLRPGDQLLVEYSDDVPFGNQARNRMIEQVYSDTDVILFQDDDDYFTDGALDYVRASFVHGKLNIYQMHYIENDFVLCKDHEFRVGNVASQMLAAPGPAWPIGRFGERYEGDFDFAAHTCAYLGDPVWHDHVISLVHHPLLKGVKHCPTPA